MWACVRMRERRCWRGWRSKQQQQQAIRVPVWAAATICVNAEYNFFFVRFSTSTRVHIFRELIEPGAAAVVAAAAWVYGCVAIVFVSVCLSFPREVFDFSCSSRAIRMYRCIFCVVVVIAVAVSSSFHVFLFRFVYSWHFVYISLGARPQCVCVCVRDDVYIGRLLSFVLPSRVHFFSREKWEKKYFVCVFFSFTSLLLNMCLLFLHIFSWNSSRLCRVSCARDWVCQCRFDYVLMHAHRRNECLFQYFIFFCFSRRCWFFCENKEKKLNCGMCESLVLFSNGSKTKKKTENKVYVYVPGETHTLNVPYSVSGVYTIWFGIVCFFMPKRGSQICRTAVSYQ